MVYACEYCGFTFKAKPRDRRKYCSQTCYFSARYGSAPEKTMTKCDYCGKVFCHRVKERKGKYTYCSSECASRARQTRFEIECRWCDKLFEITPTQHEKGRRLCSWECRVAENEDAKNRICENCGKPFRVLHPSSPQKLCSQKCNGESRRKGEYRKCPICGQRFWISQCLLSKRRFCSRDCLGKWHSETFRGPNATNWRGGVSFLPYGPEWTKERRDEIRERDDHKCMECGTTEQLSVHHIDYDKMNCSHSNLITLCLSCNSRANYNRKYWQRHYQEMLTDLELS